MSAAPCIDTLERLTLLDEQAALDAMLAEDQRLTHQARASGLCRRETFAELCDLELVCAYQRGDADLHDALYCELHLRQLTPWKVAP